MPLLLSSLVIRPTLANEKDWSMKSTHAGTGSLAPSNIVPVTGVETLPHDAQR